MSPESGQTSIKSKHENKEVALPRQIRFVSSDGQPRAKRRRINAACSTCRRRKTRCSGEHPICKTCSDNGHTCLGYKIKDTAQSHQADAYQVSGRDEDDESQSSPLRSTMSSHDHSKNSAITESASRYTFDPHTSVDPAMPTMSVSLDTGSHVTRSEVDKLSEDRSPASNLSIGSRNRVPYFRYFGPTAIVPGFKQMVVQVKEHRRSGNSLSVGSPASTFAGQSGGGGGAFGHGTPSFSGVGPQTVIDVPFYDATDPLPNNLLISHLCETFFVHLGCNFPFLQRERFLKDLEDKKVDAVLVDAVCAIAARFSAYPLLSTPNEQLSTDAIETEGGVKKSAYGQPYAQRAMAAVVDTFSCPTMAVVQACLLLAYEEFGSNHDSGLWMYLGISIRMAQDLGMEKLHGLKFEGRTGPTPKTAKSGDAGREEEKRREEVLKEILEKSEVDPALIEDQKASERERIDTFWAVFFLDRVISSGTGRPVTLRDRDIELSFPLPEEDSIDGWPAPFPPLLRVIHLYGRVTDILNNIKDVKHATPETLKKLASMESDLTGIYQGLSLKLHFNAVNFQHYVKAEQGTNFILLHIWFHTLIVLLHQPTLLHSFEGRIQQLFPNSRELSMSSAKTIADILAFAELIDIKSFLGNPFTSQPTYIAACAFLMESAIHTASQPSSRPGSPQLSGPAFAAISRAQPSGLAKGGSTDLKRSSSGKHTLLASAANQNYQRCYQALKSLETYWSGTKYILTVLDQKAMGSGDPLLYTTEEIDSAVEPPRTELTFKTPGWRRSTHSASMGSTATYASNYQKLRRASDLLRDLPGSPMDPSQAIGWSLTGTMNSPNPNFSFLYQTTNGEAGSPLSMPGDPKSQFHAVIKNLPLETATTTSEQAANTKTPSYRHSPHHAVPKNALTPYQQPLMAPPLQRFFSLPSEPASTSDAEMLLGLHSPYSSSNSGPTPNTSSVLDENQNLPPSQPQQTSNPTTVNPYDYPVPDMASTHPRPYTNRTPGGFGDVMMIESQDIDMTSPHGGLQFPLGGDLIPWLEYLPQDVLSYFGDGQSDGVVNSSGPPA